MPMSKPIVIQTILVILIETSFASPLLPATPDQSPSRSDTDRTELSKTISA